MIMADRDGGWMNEFRLAILAADCDFYEGPCVSLVVPTREGYCGILANHSNLIEAVYPGKLKFTIPGEAPRYAVVSHGMLKVEDNEVLVLVDSVERPEDIDRSRAMHAEEAAREALLQKRSRREYIETQASLARAMSRLKMKDDFGV